VRLIQVPIAPLGAYFPGLQAVAQASPGQLASVTSGQEISQRVQAMDEAERERCQAVVAHLTLRQREVLQAFVQGFTPQEVAERLCISLKTVDTHKTAILAQCRNAWAMSDDEHLDYHIMRQKFELFFKSS
jgi:CRISPR-associated protein Csx14